jgi:Raf kinase inhibitor-like YbhB/YbcL family protein
MTQSITVIVDDRDAPLGTWDHWVEFDMPAEPGSFRIPRGGDDLGLDGINSWHLPGYMGPCPPDDEEHRYYFTVFALRSPLGLPPGVDSTQVYEAMEPDVIDSVTLMGTYGR